MSGDDVQTKSVQAKTVDAVGEAICGLFSDAFSDKNDNGDTSAKMMQEALAREKQTSFGNRMGRTLGGVASTVMQMRTRMAMMAAMRSAPNGANQSQAANDSDFFASDIDDDFDDEPEL